MAQLLEKLLDKRARAWDASQAIRDRMDADDYDPTAEDEAALRKALDEVEELTGQVETAERERRLAAVDFTPHPQPRTAEDERTPDEQLRMEKRYAREFGIYLRTGRVGTQLADGFRAAAVQSTSTTAGGYLIPEGFRRIMLDVEEAYGGLMPYADNLTTTEGNALPWPVVDDTANSADYVGENTDLGDGTALAFTQITLGAYTLGVAPIRVSFQLMQDSAFNLDRFIPEKFGVRMGRKIAYELINGDGSSHVTGLIDSVSADQTLAVGQTAGFVDDGTSGGAYDSLVDLEHSVDIAYRRNARWLMNDLVVASARKIRDGNGRPIWEPSMQAGDPDRLMGYPIVVDNGMPTFAADALVAGFGDWQQAYVVRHVRDIIAMRLVERYAEVGQIGFIAFQRLDGQPTLTQARAFLAASAT